MTWRLKLLHDGLFGLRDIVEPFFNKLDSPNSASLKTRVKFISQRNFRIISFELVEVLGRILWS